MCRGVGRSRKLLVHVFVVWGDVCVRLGDQGNFWYLKYGYVRCVSVGGGEV